MQDGSEKQLFKKILEKYGVTTVIDAKTYEQIKEVISSSLSFSFSSLIYLSFSSSLQRFDKDETIEPKDVAAFLKRYQKRFGVSKQSSDRVVSFTNVEANPTIRRELVDWRKG